VGGFVVAQERKIMAWTVRPQGQTSVTPRPSDGVAHVAATAPKSRLRLRPHGAKAEQDANALIARFWGVRGSYATPRVGGGKVGGDTTCLELRFGRQTLIIDAGSGAIALGEELMRRANATPDQPQEITLLLTHAHHDHLCGLPFFAPLFDPRFHIHFFGPDLAGMRYEDIVAGYMRAPYFPVDFRALPSRRTLTTLSDGDQLLIPADGDPRLVSDGAHPPADALLVDALFSQLHPANGTMLYRVTAGASQLVFATDVEVRGQNPEADQRLVDFARGADILIHDAQYSEEDYDGADPKRGYGHSTPTMAVRVAREAQVGRLVLFHHDPHYDDRAVVELERRARAVFPDVLTAREGLELRLDGARRRLV
jgi:ribonuclease BN (tRNA processing enzyme)